MNGMIPEIYLHVYIGVLRYVAPVLVAFLLLEFLIPLLLGNGQTVGKKVFGVAVMREDSVKLSPVLLFIRAILGKYTIETMVPVLIILMIYWSVLGFFGTVILFGMLILQLVLLFSTKERSMRLVQDVPCKSFPFLFSDIRRI